MRLRAHPQALAHDTHTRTYGACLPRTRTRAQARGTSHLDFFKFVGRIVGKALYDGQYIDAHFTRSLYKHMLGQPLTYQVCVCVCVCAVCVCVYAPCVRFYAQCTHHTWRKRGRRTFTQSTPEYYKNLACSRSNNRSNDR